MKYLLEDVFKTEGVPQYTYVDPPNYGEILVDIRSPGKPVVIEGQSGTGKTTAIKKILERDLKDDGYVYLSARKARDIPEIVAVANGEKRNKYIIDDFHRLKSEQQEKIADIIKLAAEEGIEAGQPKIVIIGINRVGASLIQLVHDLSKRIGIHRIHPADRAKTMAIIENGESKLNISISNKDVIAQESKGDYWLTQLMCQYICLFNSISCSQEKSQTIEMPIGELRNKMAERLEHSYLEPVKEFCRGNKFRSTNDPYIKLLKRLSERRQSNADLTELANANPDIRGSINNIKEKRLSRLIESKEICDRYFYYNQETKFFAIEDPAFSYYLQIVDWEMVRKECGFRLTEKQYDFDFAISFAGENRALAKEIAGQLEMLDCSVFLDEYYENNYLGKAWTKAFSDIFGEKSKLVLCLLDSFHSQKIWPTFEREIFAPRIKEESVIPIYLDDTVFIGIPRDTVGIKVDKDKAVEPGFVTDNIVFRLIDRLES